MLNNLIQEVRSKACKQIDALNIRFKRDPFKTLATVQWDLQYIPKDQKDLSRLNLNLDGRSCLGRFAQAGAIVERYFPGVAIIGAEVLEDYFRNLMFGLFSNPPQDSEVLELLTYEEPHSVLLIDGKQFDPLLLLIDQNAAHPQVMRFPFWESVTVGYLIAQSLLTDDVSLKMNYLQQAKTICPGSVVLAENLAGVYSLLGDMKSAEASLRYAAQHRVNAWTLFLLATQFGDRESEALLYNTYPAAVITALQQQFGGMIDENIRRV